MADQNTTNTASTSTPTQPAQPTASTSTSTAPQTVAQPAAAAATTAAATAGQTALNPEMLAIVQALVRMQNGGQIDPALSQNAAVQHLYQLVKSGKLNQQQLLQVRRPCIFCNLMILIRSRRMSVCAIYHKGNTRDGGSKYVHCCRDVFISIDSHSNCSNGSAGMPI